MKLFVIQLFIIRQTRVYVSYMDVTYVVDVAVVVLVVDDDDDDEIVNASKFMINEYLNYFCQFLRSYKIE